MVCEVATSQGTAVRTIAVGVFCKTPAAGLFQDAPVAAAAPGGLRALSACFIRDLAATIDEVARDGAAVGYAVYTPVGTEDALAALLPPGLSPAAAMRRASSARACRMP